MVNSSKTKKPRLYNTMEKRVSLISDAGKSRHNMYKNEIRTFSNTIYKNKLKMN